MSQVTTAMDQLRRTVAAVPGALYPAHVGEHAWNLRGTFSLSVAALTAVILPAFAMFVKMSEDIAYRCGCSHWPHGPSGAGSV